MFRTGSASHDPVRIYHRRAAVRDSVAAATHSRDDCATKHKKHEAIKPRDQRTSLAWRATSEYARVTGKAIGTQKAAAHDSEQPSMDTTLVDSVGGLASLIVSVGVGVGVGVGLAAACGLRVFLPLLIAAIGGKLGLVNPGEHFAWVTSWPALAALATASFAEIVAYYVPWLDNALDALTTPMASAAGAVVGAVAIGGPVAALLMDPNTLGGVGGGELGPLLGWTMPLIAGGVGVGVGAGTGLAVSSGVQATTVAARGTSSVTTLGVANPIVSTLENFGALVIGVAAVVLPAVLAAMLVLAAGVVLVIMLRRRASRNAVAIAAQT